MRRLPRFAVDEYAQLIGDLLRCGYEVRPVAELAVQHEGLALYLRHDIDIHVPGIERIGEAEARLGVSATYYVPLTLPFNPFYPENRRILGELVAMGHELGLHYDLADYPDDPDDALARLDREATTLSEISGQSVRTVCMHAPSLRGEDRFRGVESYLNPHHSRYATTLLYISDSCRAWHDEQLLRCFGDEPPPRVMLNTHPELWLGASEQSREEFLRGPLLASALEQQRTFLIDELGDAWRVHPGPAAEDARETRSE